MCIHICPNPVLFRLLCDAVPPRFTSDLLTSYLYYCCVYYCCVPLLSGAAGPALAHKMPPRSRRRPRGRSRRAISSCQGPRCRGTPGPRHSRHRGRRRPPPSPTLGRPHCRDEILAPGEQPRRPLENIVGVCLCFPFKIANPFRLFQWSIRLLVWWPCVVDAWRGVSCRGVAWHVEIFSQLQSFRGSNFLFVKQLPSCRFVRFWACLTVNVPYPTVLGRRARCRSDLIPHTLFLHYTVRWFIQ